MSELKEILEKAHMAGQINAGVDPSYSEAQRYAEKAMLLYETRIQGLVDALESIKFVYDFRSELVTSDEDLAGTMYDRAAQALTAYKDGNEANHKKILLEEPTITWGSIFTAYKEGKS